MRARSPRSLGHSLGGLRARFAPMTAASARRALGTKITKAC